MSAPEGGIRAAFLRLWGPPESQARFLWVPRAKEAVRETPRRQGVDRAARL